MWLISPAFFGTKGDSGGDDDDDEGCGDKDRKIPAQQDDAKMISRLSLIPEGDAAASLSGNRTSFKCAASLFSGNHNLFQYNCNNNEGDDGNDDDDDDDDG